MRMHAALDINDRLQIRWQLLEKDQIYLLVSTQCLSLTGFRPTAVVAAEAVKHLRVRSLACPAALFLFVANGAFRGARDTK